MKGKIGQNWRKLRKTKKNQVKLSKPSNIIHILPPGSDICRQDYICLCHVIADIKDIKAFSPKITHFVDIIISYLVLPLCQYIKGNLIFCIKIIFWDSLQKVSHPHCCLVFPSLA